MFIVSTVCQWGQHGIKPISSEGDAYILNTNRMFEITANRDIGPFSTSSLFFYQNPDDSRDGGARMRISSTAAQIITASDLDVGSNSVTFNVFPDNHDTTGTPVARTLQKKDVAYLYAHPNTSYTYLVYVNEAWDVKKVVISHTGLAAWLLLLT